MYIDDAGSAEYRGNSRKGMNLRRTVEVAVLAGSEFQVLV